MTQYQSALTPTVGPEAFAELFTAGLPLLDVRAPVEFARGAFPAAMNIPLLDDEERHQVGTRYRQAGQQAAIDLGHELVSGERKQQRLQAWSDWISRNPDGLLYCFRGGLRSKLVQEWLAAEGLQMPRIEGGYKALRRFLIDTLEREAGRLDYIIVAGKTGCGKTHLLNRLYASLDLEGLANHRGSAFGKRLGGQPTQIDFENRIGIELLKLQNGKAQQPARIFIEDESHSVGSVSVPRLLFTRMRTAPLAVIEQPLEARVSTILNDYILANLSDFEQHHGNQAFAAFADYLTESLGRIQRRLGPDRFHHLRDLLSGALRQHAQSGDCSGHRHWIRALLQNYYDPMYEYQLGKKMDRLVFRGDAEEFMRWAQHLDTGDSS